MPGRSPGTISNVYNFIAVDSPFRGVPAVDAKQAGTQYCLFMQVPRCSSDFLSDAPRDVRQAVDYYAPRIDGAGHSGTGDHQRHGVRGRHVPALAAAAPRCLNAMDAPPLRQYDCRVTRNLLSFGFDRCRGCGESGRGTSVYRCTWPDGRMTFERHCDLCWMLWRRRLEAWGASVTQLLEL